MTKGKWTVVATFSLSAAFVLVAGSVLFSLLEANQSRREAEHLLESFRRLQVGATSEDAVAQITDPFQKHRSDGTMNGAVAWTFRYDNYPMSRLHLAPYASMDATVVFKDGVLQKKSAMLFVASGISATVEERKAGFGFPAGDVSDEVPRHRTGITWNSATAIRSITISDNTSLEVEKREKDWHIDLRCLDKLRGCIDARSIIPYVENEAVSASALSR
jgi:hypothetical protein